jgi:hypothetical protein
LDEFLNIAENNIGVEKLSNNALNGEEVKGEKFDPKSKINEYIAATSDSGFNLDEVMNPGDLKLEDLCKELGLIEPNE